MATKPLIILAQHKLLLLIPFLIVLPVAVGYTLVTSPTRYASSATVWVRQPTFIAFTQDSGVNPYLSYAQNQSNLLNELLTTRSFPSAVATRVGLPATDNSAQIVRTGTAVGTNGAYSVTVTHVSKDPIEAQKIVQGIVDEFQSKYFLDTSADALRAAQFYQARIPQAAQALDTARAALASYARQHPEAAASSIDPQYQTLKAEVDHAQSTYDQTLTSLQQVSNTGSSTLDAIQRSFEEVDRPQVPSSALPPSKKSLLAVPLAGLLLAISLSAMAYTFLLRTDSTIQIAEDLQALPGLALLGTIPDVRVASARSWPGQFSRLATATFGMKTRH